MAKISPVSIKYMIHAIFSAEGALEKPDVIGAIFGQTEGLLGADLEMRELQKEGKIGRIEVELERKDKKTTGKIKIPTALDQSETTLIAAAVETIERIGPTDAQIEIERIEDVRGSKRDYIIERAKKLMQEIHGSTDSREISREIKEHSRTSDIAEYGDEKLPSGDLSGKEIIVVEGRADVMNLLRNGIRNVIAMNGTKLPDSIKALSREKDITLFVDGDRGGKLIARNVLDNAKIKDIAIAPDGKEVEELMGKEIWMALRKKISSDEFFRGKSFDRFEKGDATRSEPRIAPGETARVSTSNSSKLSPEETKEGLRKFSSEVKDSGKALILDSNFKMIKEVSARAVSSSLKRIEGNPMAIVMDGSVTGSLIDAAEEIGIQAIMASNFSATSEKIQLLSL
ncbi:DNA primase [Candidatus Pacearchaeota archaeon]|nr:DNA primase [Candidatus Pacearchaeota archaeon]